MTPEKERLDSLENPDVEISAKVKSRKLRFEEVPETETRFWGSPGRESVSGTERGNLPDEIQSGVTYRDSGVKLKIASQLRRGEIGPEERQKEA